MGSAACRTQTATISGSVRGVVLGGGGDNGGGEHPVVDWHGGWLDKWEGLLADPCTTGSTVARRLVGRH